MARAYPSAGSAFTYVAQEIHPSIGYVTGWSMVMDYSRESETLCVIGRRGKAHEFAPSHIPDWGWKIISPWPSPCPEPARNQDLGARERGMTAGMSAVVVVIFVTAIRYIFGHPHSDPHSSRAVLRSADLHLGQSFRLHFDCGALLYRFRCGISTLSEEAENPRRKFLLATVLTCVVTVFLSAAEVYVAPAYFGAATEPFERRTPRMCGPRPRTWAPLFTIRPE